MSTKQEIRPAPTISERTPHVRHIYHGVCNRDRNPRVARCGHKSGPMVGVPYDPRLPDICMVRHELVGRPCTVCGEW